MSTRNLRSRLLYRKEGIRKNAEGVATCGNGNTRRSLVSRKRHRMEAQYDNAEQYLKELRRFSPAEIRNDARTREAILNLSSNIMASLRNPIDVVMDISIAPIQTAAVKIALDLDLFKLIAEQDDPISTKDLCVRSKAEELLVSRLLRFLNGFGLVCEIERDVWQATTATRTMTEEPVVAGYRYRYDVTVASVIQAPAYFLQHDYRCPTDPESGIHQFAHQTRDNIFDHLRKEKPERLHDFNVWMGNTLGIRRHWFEWYPVESRLLEGFESSRAFLVDIGGGKGHDLQAFRKEYPDVDGRLILQDLPPALESIAEGSLDPTIERQAYDFFEPNPVHGARTYFLHYILHDWPDEFCVRILKRVLAAMIPGYSRLLIHELVLPEEGSSARQSTLDMLMMLFNSGMERTLTQWTNLLKRAGFEVTGVWHSGEGDKAGGVIEAMVPSPTIA